MSNILRQYDWNNPKAMNMEKLTNVFANLTLSDKLTVYRVLTDKRKLVLRKGYVVWKKENVKRQFDQKCEDLLAPLSDFMGDAVLKNDNEFLLTLGILIGNIPTHRHHDTPSPNHNVEQESFEVAKAKMITIYETMRSRKMTPLIEEDTFYSQLQSLQYVPQVTLTEYLTRMKVRWVKSYRYAGVGKVRAGALAKALTTWTKGIHNDGIDQKYHEWRDSIPSDLEYKAKEYFAVTDHNANELADRLNTTQMEGDKAWEDFSH